MPGSILDMLNLKSLWCVKVEFLMCSCKDEFGAQFKKCIYLSGNTCLRRYRYICSRSCVYGRTRDGIVTRMRGEGEGGDLRRGVKSQG